MLDTALISTVTSILMLGVWVLYLHIVFLQYRQNNKPFLIIHHAHENDPSALCMFVNMSKEPVHVQAVLAKIRYKNGTTKTHYITDYSRISTDDKNIQDRLKQGPLQPGGYLLLGSFEDVITGKTAKASENKLYQELYKVQSLELCIAVIHGPTKFQIGARRHFKIEKEDNLTIKAHSIYTEQLVSKRKQQIVRRWIEESLQPVEVGENQHLETSQSFKKIQKEND